MIYKIINDIFIDTKKLDNINISYIKKLDKEKKEEFLKNSIDKRLSKYKRRYSNDKKIKLKKIEPEYEKWLEEIIINLKQIDILTIDDLKKIHKIFFPKGIWWESISHSWEKYYAFYESGIFREKEEYVIVDNKQYTYLSPTYINEAIENLLNYFNKDEDTDTFKKIIIFYIYFCEIHPFYNWNWTIALFISEYLLYKNNIDFSISDFLTSLNLKETLEFFKEWFSWNYEKIFTQLKNKAMLT